jgi:stalled ribosome alternative rescue factor ArfA
MQKRIPRKINPIAKTLRSGFFKLKIVKAKKGKGSYSRKKKS